MKRFHHILLLSGFMLLRCAVVSGQASLKLVVTPTSIGKDETATISLVVDNAKEITYITPPDLRNFIVISGPNRESGYQYINGVNRQFAGISYIVQPKAPGNFNIGRGTAKADGKVINSNTATLKVGKQSSVSVKKLPFPFSAQVSPMDAGIDNVYTDYVLKKGENVTDKINRNIFIRVETDKTSCYVGEPVLVTYKLYTRLKSESNITRNPSFNGFSVIDLVQGSEGQAETEKLNGKLFNVYTLRKSQLYPLQSGDIELEKAEVENEIQFVDEAYLNQSAFMGGDLFDDMGITGIPSQYIHREKVTLQSKPMLIHVSELPSAGKPASFKGTTGSFDIAASLEKNSFTTDDAGKLKLVISGEGNLALINPPSISWPGGFDNFEPRSKEEINRMATPVSGSKFFEYPFTVVKPGEYTMPPVEFSYFDTRLKQYKTISTQPIRFTVTRGTGKPSSATAALSLKNNPGMLENFVSHRGWVVGSLALFIIGGLLIWLKRESRKSPEIIKVDTPIIEQPETETTPDQIELKVNPLAASEEKLVAHDSRGFYETLDTDLRVFLAGRLNIEPGSVDKKTIASNADKLGIDVDTVLKIHQLLDEISWQLYTPGISSGNMEQSFQLANELIHALRQT